MENKISICSDPAIFMPKLAECDECAAFEARLSRLEDLLEGFERVELVKTNADGETVSVTIAGLVETIAAQIDYGTGGDGTGGDDTGGDDTGGDDTGGDDTGGDDTGGDDTGGAEGQSEGEEQP